MGAAPAYCPPTHDPCDNLTLIFNPTLRENASLSPKRIRLSPNFACILGERRVLREKSFRMNPLCGTPSLSKLKKFSSFESGTTVLRQCLRPLRNHAAERTVTGSFTRHPLRKITFSHFWLRLSTRTSSDIQLASMLAPLSVWANASALCSVMSQNRRPLDASVRSVSPYFQDA